MGYVVLKPQVDAVLYQGAFSLSIPNYNSADIDRSTIGQLFFCYHVPQTLLISIRVANVFVNLAKTMFKMVSN